jgi:hypothetical protein
LDQRGRRRACTASHLFFFQSCSPVWAASRPVSRSLYLILFLLNENDAQISCVFKKKNRPADNKRNKTSSGNNAHHVHFQGTAIWICKPHCHYPTYGTLDHHLKSLTKHIVHNHLSF